MPILGATGIFPAPTADMYSTQQAFDFIQALYNSKYLVYLMAIVFAVALVLIIMKRTALASLLILPITVNILAFHLFLDGGLFTGGAVMADILFLLNVYFLWQNRSQYKGLLEKA